MPNNQDIVNEAIGFLGPDGKPTFNLNEPFKKALKKLGAEIDFLGALESCSCDVNNLKSCIKNFIDKILKSETSIEGKSCNSPNCRECLREKAVKSDECIKVTVCEDADCGECKAFAGLLASLKGTLSEIRKCMKGTRNEELCKDRCEGCGLSRWVDWVLDTCYDLNRAKELSKALDELKKKLGNRFCGFLALLVSAYTAAIIKPSELWRIDWFISLAYAASGKVLPLCPSKGDVAALVYYAYLQGCNSACTSCTINMSSLKEIVEKLVSP